MKKPSILILPHDAGNVSPLVARRFRELGYDAKAIVFSQSYLGYKVEPPDVVIGGRGIKALLILEIKRWFVLWEALKYDIIIFTFGSSILPNPAFIGHGLSSRITPRLRNIYNLYAYLFAATMLDVWLLHVLGKKICVLFQGGDARRGDILKARGLPDIEEEPPGYYVAWIDRLKARRARLWAKWADVIYTHNPDLAWGLCGEVKFLPYPIEVKDEQV